MDNNLYNGKLKQICLTGEYELDFTSKNSIILPEMLINQLENNLNYCFHPLDGCLLIKFDLSSEPLFLKQAENVKWSPTIYNIFRKFNIYPSQAFFAEKNSECSINLIKSVLSSEIFSKELIKLQGRDFEKLISEIFAQYGYIVELNVRAQYAEIDIIAFTHKNTQEKLLIECKQKGISGNKVGISVIHRLFGLKEILKLNNNSIKHSLVISTTGFTKNATKSVLTNQLELTLLDFEKLLEWINFNNPINKNVYFPLVQKGTIFENSISVNSEILEYLNEDKFTIFAYQDFIELWGTNQYQKHIDRQPEDFFEIFQNLLSKDKITA
ncbi:MAG: restriction endonuclease [Lewinellaceae bacterium]|nr:restriction endonuclease [Lewinellaceae bacterium]